VDGVQPFMGNTDIVQGKITYQRAPYNVLYVEEQGNTLFVGTNDGAINAYDLKTKKLINRQRFDSSNTNFTADKKYIWMSSANQGLLRFSKSNLNEVKKVAINWGASLDFNKISKTIVVVNDAGTKVWVTLGYKDFDKIIQYDQDLNKQAEYSILGEFPISYDKMAIATLLSVKDKLYVATNRGIAVLDATGTVTKIIENEDFNIAEVRFMIPDAVKDVVYCASLSQVYTLKNNTVKKIFTTVGKDSVEQISALTKAGDNLIVGTGHGVILISTTGKKLSEINQPLFDDIDKHGKLITPKRLINSDVQAAVYLKGNRAYLGTSSGRVALVDLQKKSLISTVLIDKRGYVQIHWRNYIDLFNNIDFALYLRNSFIVCGLTAFFAMLIATVTAYSLVRFDFPGKRMISTAILSTQMIPGVMTLIPVYIMFMKFQELSGIPVQGTYWGLVFVYSAFFLPFSVWILRGFFASIPIALEEAATIDGCTPLQIFWRIAIPLSIPGIVATGIFIFLVAWDELMFAWILTNAQTMTIPVGIRLFVGNFQNRYDLLMAASTVATIPVMIMFVLLQKQIVSGLTSGAVKD
jgi:multiple sugar transport system permease protein